jgi:hypothetical protein
MLRNMVLKISKGAQLWGFKSKNVSYFNAWGVKGRRNCAPIGQRYGDWKERLGSIKC